MLDKYKICISISLAVESDCWEVQELEVAKFTSKYLKLIRGATD